MSSFTKETTLIEDAAYSLPGIFSITLPIVYGKRHQALGGLLARAREIPLSPHGLENPERVARLAYPACRGVIDAEVETFPSRIGPSYDRFHELLVPSLADQQIRLPCLTSKLESVSGTRKPTGYVFRARTGALGVVTITTTEDLSQLDSLTLVHPWIDYLLDRQPVGKIPETDPENTSPQLPSIGDPPSLSGPSNPTPMVRPRRASRIMAAIAWPFNGSDTHTLQSPTPVSLLEKRMEVLRFIVRLRRPFSALLFARNRQHVEEYKRVATESLVTVQIEELTATVLNKVIEGVGMLDVL